jgi:hypothetical protein
LDQGFNLVIITDRPCRLAPHMPEALRLGYPGKKLNPYESLYHHLCGVGPARPCQGATTIMRKCLIALVMQPHQHFLHTMATLREELLCAVAGRLIDINIKYLAEREKACSTR